MAHIKLYNTFELAKVNLSHHKDILLGTITDKLIRVALGEILDHAKNEETTYKLEEISSGYEGVSIYEIVECYQLIRDNIIKLMGDDRPRCHTPYRYYRGVITVPYIDKGPSEEQIQCSKKAYIVPIDSVERQVKHLIEPYMELTPAVLTNISFAYFNYMAKNFFMGFSKEDIEHPLAAYFTNEVLIEHIFKNFKGKDDDYCFSDYAELDTDDLINEVFKGVDETLSRYFYDTVDSMGIDENDIVYLFNTDNTKIKILVDRIDLKTRVFNMVFDHTRATLKTEVVNGHGDFCKSNL